MPMSSPQITRMLGLSMGVRARSADLGSPRFATFATPGLFVFFAIAGFSSLFFKSAIMREVGLFKPRNIAGSSVRRPEFGRKHRADDSAAAPSRTFRA